MWAHDFTPALDTACCDNERCVVVVVQRSTHLTPPVNSGDAFPLVTLRLRAEMERE